jgi:hypothetical protein
VAQPRCPLGRLLRIRLLGERVALDAGEHAAAVGADDDAADRARDERGQASDRVHVLPGVGEVGPAAAVKPAAVQLWHQNSAGIADAPEADDKFGILPT